MGALRTLFAIAVVFSHCWPDGPVFVGGRNAVQLFYIISGFLISYVLVERKSYPSVKDFYINRYLRLYPMYVVVALLTLLAYYCTGFAASEAQHFADVYKTAPDSARILLVFSNLFLFTQDWVMFSGVHDHTLGFAAHYKDSDVLLWQGLIVPQAWTLGVELSFYLLAPFILTRRKVIYALLAFSVTLRASLILYGGVGGGLGLQDPWTYRFFPNELALFLLGALSHQLLLPRYKRWLGDKMPRYSAMATGFLIVFSACYFLIPLKDGMKSPLLFVVFLALVHFAFTYQSRSKLDNRIGNLSYPIYISHMFVIFLCERFFPLLNIENPYLIAILYVAVTILFALMLNSCVGEPFEKVRRHFRRDNRPAVTPE